MDDKVWVAEIEWYGPEPGDYAGWISVHRTEQGARKALQQRADEYDLDLEAIDSGDEPSKSTYALSHLELQE